MEYSTESSINVTRHQPTSGRGQIPFAIFPILTLLIAGFVVPIIAAIKRKNWALLIIPLGLVVLLITLSTLHFIDASGQVAQSTGIDPDHTHITHTPDRVESDNSTYNSARTTEYNINSNINVTRQPAPPIQIAPKASFLLWVILMALTGLVAVIIIAIVRKKWAVIYIPLAVAGVLVLGVLVLRFAGVPTPSGQATQVTQIGTPQMPAATSVKALPAVWSPGIEKEFKADVYYSKTAAFRGIAIYLEYMFANNTRYSKSLPGKIALLTYKDQFSKELIDEAISIFKDIMPDTELYHVSAGTASSDSELFNAKNDNWISLRLNESPGRPGNVRLNGALVNSYLNNDDFKSGTIKMYANLNSSSSSQSIEYTEKPWLENFSAFKNTYPGQFAVAYSQNTCRNDNEARNDALNQAQRIVSQMLRDMRGSAKLANGSFTLSHRDLSQHGIIVDDFTQSFRGSSSPIYRQALLLDLSWDRIEPLALQKIRGYNQTRQSWAYHIFSAIGIALAICVIYLILNAATKGYYTVVLRILTVIGIIVVVVVILGLV